MWVKKEGVILFVTEVFAQQHGKHVEELFHLVLVHAGQDRLQERILTEAL